MRAKAKLAASVARLNAHLAQAGVATGGGPQRSVVGPEGSQCALSASRRCDRAKLAKLAEGDAKSQCALSASRRCDDLQWLAAFKACGMSQCALSASRRCDPRLGPTSWPLGLGCLNAHLAQAGVATAQAAAQAVELAKGLNAHLAQAGVATPPVCSKRSGRGKCLNAHLAQAGVATVGRRARSGGGAGVSQCALSASRRCDHGGWPLLGALDFEGLNAHLAQAGVATSVHALPP